MTMPPAAVEAVWKSYGTTEVLRGVSVVFSPGRLTALVGPNGAGKTTLLRIVAGLQHPTRGRVLAHDVLYFGGYDLLPVRGTIVRFRRALGLGDAGADRRALATLSRGQLQQVGLDASLDLAPETLLLDEPWSSLEPDARDRLNERLALFAASGRIVVCSSHELDEVARVADDVAFLRDGAVQSVRRESLGGNRFDRDGLLVRYKGIT